MISHSLATPDRELMIAMWWNHSKAPPLCFPQRGGCVHGYHDYNDDAYFDYDGNDDKMPSQMDVTLWC